MKKVISFLLVFTLSAALAGCAKGSSDNSKDSKTNEETSVVLKGTIVGGCGGTDSGDLNTILLDQTTNIKGKDVERVWLTDNSIENFIPTKYFTYVLEGGKCLKDEYYEKIPVEVEIDLNSVESQDVFFTYAKTKNVISVDGETNPRDKSKDEYPLDYYKDVFNALSSSENRDTAYVVTKDIKDYYLYKNTNKDDDFRVAVDKILESGLYINMLEGDYEIDTKKRNSEEEAEKILSEKNDEKQNSDAEGLSKLKGYETETINAKIVDYTKYTCAVIPEYSGINKNKLKQVALVNDYYPEGPYTEVNFAIFGKVYNLQILYSESMDSEYRISKIGDKENTLITYKTKFPTDMSHILVRFSVDRGEGTYTNHEFILDDMRDISDFDELLFD